MIATQSFEALAHAVRVVRGVCGLAGPHDLLDDIRGHLHRCGILAAVRTHDTPALFDWLISVLSFQGISNRVAEAYLDHHGNVTWADIEAALSRRPSCPKLGGYWLFENCRYGKAAGRCSMPQFLPACPLPAHPLRNGRLNQTAFSLFLFMRDVANGDFVAWIDSRLRAGKRGPDPDSVAAQRQQLIEPLCGIYGVSDKVMTMAMASLLLGAGSRQRRWFEVGASMIVVDTLVHNFLHRTGNLRRFDADHGYGHGCYGPGGCAEVLALVARQIDAQAFNSAFPSVFPRFVQLAIWRFCAIDEFNVCNGNRIDDRFACTNRFCQLYEHCDHVALHKSAEQQRFASA
jgi:hypothetical protein